MTKAPADLRSLARGHTELAIRTLSGIATSSDNDGARVAACIHILDRGWGKAPQVHAGADGEGALQVTIRHIIEGRDGLPIDQARDTIATHAKLINGNSKLDDNSG